ncbi:hypothetical protein Ddye_027484 [Dipteronia dyeriana]|uniref:Uncharacterized protein n=1 Tax=Dipteronia dyeriana TaxID=168575 RepID=A0AAD9WQ81_9ROSI|nr:hypothetical protein Ddye_027484 [Dipteronia dyeriana]
MKILNLRSNNFHSHILKELCQLSSSQILDFAQNNLSGNIPSCINNFSAMVTVDHSVSSDLYYLKGEINFAEYVLLVWKGKTYEHSTILKLGNGLIKDQRPKTNPTYDFDPIGVKPYPPPPYTDCCSFNFVQSNRQRFSVVEPSKLPHSRTGDSPPQLDRRNPDGRMDNLAKPRCEAKPASGANVVVSHRGGGCKGGEAASVEARSACQGRKAVPSTARLEAGRARHYP